MANPFRDFNTYKIDPLSEIRNAGIVTSGDVYWVSSVSDSNHTTRRNDLGREVVKESVQAAIDASLDNHNDYIMVIPTDNGTTRVLGTAIDVNKDRVHILGVGYKPSPQIYPGLTFQGFVVATGNDTELVMVTGAGVEMGGLKVLGTSGTHANGTVTATFRMGTASSGTPHDLWLHDMHIENNNAAAAGGTAPVFELTGAVAAGIGGLRVEDSWIGNLSWAPTPLVNLSGTAGPSRPEWRNVTFVLDAQATTDAFISGGTGATGYQLFKDCQFINVESGTAVASAYSGIALADNPVIFRNCVANNTTQVGSGAEFYKSPVASGTAASVRDYGIAVGTAALTPV